MSLSTGERLDYLWHNSSIQHKVQQIILDIIRLFSIAIFNVCYSSIMLLVRQKNYMFLKVSFCRILIRPSSG